MSEENMNSLAGFGYSESCSAGNLDSTPVMFSSNGGGMAMEMIGFMAAPWNHHHQGLDDPSIMMVSDGRNRNANQGLSLSLSSLNSGLRHGDAPSSSRFVTLQSPPPTVHDRINLRVSKYLGPVQDLLNEFCGVKAENSLKLKPKNQVPEEEDVIKKEFLYSLDLLELERRRKTLLQMLDEVERRYKHYCNQMKALVMSFEVVAGDGSAMVYSEMASKAMSRHFRRLRDGIMSQIRATKKAIGEQDVAAPGTTKGDTPRLRLVDQTLRQQKAPHQTNFMDSHPWRPQRGLPERAVSILRAWLFEHFLNPYPSDVDKHILARQTGLSRSQVSNWFINARVRLWKPMVEEIYIEELKESETMTSNDTAIDDQRDSECLSSIINTHKKNKGVGVEGKLPEFTADNGKMGFRLILGTGAGQNSSIYFEREMEDCENYSLLESENQKPPYRNLMEAQLLHDLAG